MRQDDTDGNCESDLLEFLTVIRVKMNARNTDAEYLEAYMEFDKTNDGEI